MIRIAQQVSRAIRILRGNRDESARASHLVVSKERFAYNELLQVNQAETEKYSLSTFFERKTMSTKTAFKRVALVAAAALAIGGFSAVSANASTSGQAAPTFPASASAVTGTYTTVTLTAGTNDKYYTITSSGVGTVLYPSAPTSPDTTGLIAGASEVWYAGATPGATTFNATGNDVLTFSVYSAVAGSQTISITGNSTAVNTTTITWGAASTLAAANSFVVANNATDVVETTVGTNAGTLKALSAAADTISATGSPTATLVGGALVGLYNNASTPAAWTSDKISASVAGPGTVTISNVTPTGDIKTAGSTVALSGTTSAGRSVTTGSAGAYALVKLYSDGTTGSTTVTVTDSTLGVVIGTFTATAYSNTIAKLTATVNNNVPLSIPAGFTTADGEGFAGANGTANTAPVSVVAADSLGNAIPNQAAEIAVSSGTTTVATVAATPSWDSVNSFYYPVITPVSAGTTVLTFTDVATGAVVATATVTVNTAVVASLKATTDASTYDPGTKVVYTLTAADAAGNPVADGKYTALLSTAPTSNVGLQGALPAADVTFTGGVANYTVYAPLATANVAVAGGVISSTAATVASALQGGTLAEADFATTGSSDNAANAATDAANEATDAANAATDAANAAADSADAATQAAQDAGDKADAALAAVTALSQQVTTLLAKVAAVSAALAKISAAIAKLPKK